MGGPARRLADRNLHPGRWRDTAARHETSDTGGHHACDLTVRDIGTPSFVGRSRRARTCRAWRYRTEIGLRGDTAPLRHAVANPLGNAPGRGGQHLVLGLRSGSVVEVKVDGPGIPAN